MCLFQKQGLLNKGTSLLLGDSTGLLSTPEPEMGKIKQYKAMWQKEEEIDVCDQEEEEVEDVELVKIEPLFQCLSLISHTR